MAGPQNRRSQGTSRADQRSAHQSVEVVSHEGRGAGPGAVGDGGHDVVHQKEGPGGDLPDQEDEKVGGEEPDGEAEEDHRQAPSNSKADRTKQTRTPTPEGI